LVIDGKENPPAAKKYPWLDILTGEGFTKLENPDHFASE